LQQLTNVYIIVEDTSSVLIIFDNIFHFRKFY